MTKLPLAIVSTLRHRYVCKAKINSTLVVSRYKSKWVTIYGQNYQPTIIDYKNCQGDQENNEHRYSVKIQQVRKII